MATDDRLTQLRDAMEVVVDEVHHLVERFRAAISSFAEEFRDRADLVRQASSLRPCASEVSKRGLAASNATLF